jgi:hypothetical protein
MWYACRNGVMSGPVPEQAIIEWLAAGAVDMCVRHVSSNDFTWMSIPKSPFASLLHPEWFRRPDLTTKWEMAALEIGIKERKDASYARIEKEFGAETVARLRRGTVLVGDSEEMVTLVWGYPDESQEKVTSKASTTTLKWIDEYPRKRITRVVRIKNDKVEMIDQR